VSVVAWCPGKPGILASWDSASKEAKIWNTGTKHCLHTICCRDDRFDSYCPALFRLAFSPDGELLAIREQEVKVVRVETGEVAAVCRVHPGMVSWSPGGDRLAVVTKQAERWNKVSLFSFQTSLKAAAALAVAACLGERRAGREEALEQLGLPNTLERYLELFWK
jgi:WD40 repeat protein